MTLLSSLLLANCKQNCKHHNIHSCTSSKYANEHMKYL